MTLKRNDPCHCGSGKKYKHCHMKEDRAQEKAEKAAQKAARFVPARSVAPTSDIATTGNPQPKEVDPEIAFFNRLYEKFEEASYENKIFILRSAIEDKVLDDELTFEFFNDLYPRMAERGERAEFADLVLLLRTHQPDMYEKEIYWFWSWEVTNALALSDEEALQHATAQLIKYGGQDLDQFFPVFNCLLYHDRRAALLDAMNQYTVEIERGKYIGDVGYEVNRKLAHLVLLDYIETTPQDDLLRADNFNQLCTALAAHVKDLQRDALEEFISWSGGLSRGAWTLTDFTFPDQPTQRGWDDDEGYHEDPVSVYLRHLGMNSSITHAKLTTYH